MPINHTSTLRHVKAANRNLPQRLAREGVSLSYHSSVDTLYVTIGAPREADTIAISEDVSLRLDPETDIILGADVLNFFRDVLPQQGASAFSTSALKILKSGKPLILTGSEAANIAALLSPA